MLCLIQRRSKGERTRVTAKPLSDSQEPLTRQEGPATPGPAPRAELPLSHHIANSPVKPWGPGVRDPASPSPSAARGPASDRSMARGRLTVENSGRQNHSVKVIPNNCLPEIRRHSGLPACLIPAARAWDRGAAAARPPPKREPARRRGSCLGCPFLERMGQGRAGWVSERSRQMPTSLVAPPVRASVHIPCAFIWCPYAMHLPEHSHLPALH